MREAGLGEQRETGREGSGRRGAAGAGPQPPTARGCALLSLSLSLCLPAGAVCPGLSHFGLCSATCWGGSPAVLEWSL